MGPRIAIVGAGAVGGYVGALMAQAGHDVTLIDAWPEHVDILRTRGMKIDHVIEGDTQIIPVKAAHICDVQEISKEPPIDVAMISTKSYDTVWATAMIAPYLSASGYVVSMQNCINEDRVAGVVGWGRTVGCICAGISVDMQEPGYIRRTTARGQAQRPIFRVGEVHGRTTQRVTDLSAIIAAADGSTVTNNLWGERWSKLCVNAMRNPLSAASGLSGNGIERNPAIRRFGIRLGGQAVRVGQALGYELVQVNYIEPELLALASEGDAASVDEVDRQLLEATRSTIRSDLQRPSLAQDIAKGRKTEIDFINGLVVEMGRKIGKPIDAHEKMVELVKGIEKGTVEPGASHFEALDCDADNQAGTSDAPAVTSWDTTSSSVSS